jgi:hypothetical protein
MDGSNNPSSRHEDHQEPGAFCVYGGERGLMRTLSVRLVVWNDKDSRRLAPPRKRGGVRLMDGSNNPSLRCEGLQDAYMGEAR